MVKHQVERVTARFLAQLRIQGDVAADDRLQSRADVTEQTAGSYGDAADHTETRHRAVARNFERRGHHVVVDRHAASPKIRYQVSGIRYQVSGITTTGH